MDLISTESSNVMKKAMDGLMSRHNAITSNLANVDTPGYKPLRVDFEDKLRQAVINSDRRKDQVRDLNKRNLHFNQGMLELRTNNAKHFGAQVVTPSDVKIKAYQDDYITTRNDSNAIDIDTEMTELAKNTMQYEAIAKMESGHFMNMKEILRSGGQ